MSNRGKEHSVSISGTEWPPKKTEDGDESDKTPSGKDKKQKDDKQRSPARSIHLTLAKDNMFVKKIASEKGIDIEKTEDEGKRSSVREMIRSMEKKDTKEEPAKRTVKADSSTQNLVKYYNTLSGAKKKPKKGAKFGAKNRYTENLAKRNLLTDTEKRKIKRKAKARSANRVRPRFRLSNNRRQPQKPLQPIERNGDGKNTSTEAKDQDETQDGEIEREIIENERKLINPTMDNSIRNFIANLKPVVHKRPSMKRAAAAGEGLQLFGVEGSLDYGPMIQDPKVFKEKEATKSPRKEQKKKKKKPVPKPKVTENFRKQRTGERVKKGFEEIEIDQNEAKEIVQKEKKQEPKPVPSSKPKQKALDMSKLAISGKNKWWVKDIKKGGSKSSIGQVSVPETPLSASTFKGFTPITLNSFKDDEKKRPVNLASFNLESSEEDTQSESDLSAFFRDNKTVDTESIAAYPPQPIGHQQFPGGMFDARSVGSLNTFKTRGKETVVTQMTTRTVQSLNSVLDPLSYVFSARYKEEFEDFQQSVFDCFRNRNLKDPNAVIRASIKHIRTENDFTREFGLPPEDAVVSIDRYQPILTYTDVHSRPTSYKTFTLLAAVRKLGYETRYTSLWLELKRQLEVRLKTQVQNLQAEDQSTFAKLDALQAALVAMEDLHRMMAQIRGIFFRPCRQVVMSFLNAMKTNVFADSTERTTYDAVKRLHRRLKKVISAENRLRSKEIGLILVEGTNWKCGICYERDGPRSKYQRRLPNCNHVFHKACVDDWLEKHYICPLCNEDADKKHPRSLRPCSNLFAEFFYYVFLLFPLMGAVLGAMIAGTSLFFQRNFSKDGEVVVDTADNGFVKCLVSSYTLGFFIFSFLTQSFSLLRFFGTKEYDNEIWLLLPTLLGLVWSPFLAFVLSDRFQDPQDVADADTLKEAWKGFAGLMLFYLLFAILSRAFVTYVLPYVGWCLINFSDSLKEATLSEKIYAAYFWCCCSAFYYCCFGDDEDEVQDQGENTDYIELHSPDLEKSMDEEIEEHRETNLFSAVSDTRSEEEVDLDAFFAAEKKVTAEEDRFNFRDSLTEIEKVDTLSDPSEDGVGVPKEKMGV